MVGAYIAISKLRHLPLRPMNRITYLPAWRIETEWYILMLRMMKSSVPDYHTMLTKHVVLSSIRTPINLSARALFFDATSSHAVCKVPVLSQQRTHDCDNAVKCWELDDFTRNAPERRKLSLMARDALSHACHRVFIHRARIRLVERLTYPIPEKCPRPSDIEYDIEYTKSQSNVEYQFRSLPTFWRVGYLVPTQKGSSNCFLPAAHNCFLTATKEARARSGKLVVSCFTVSRAEAFILIYRRVSITKVFWLYAVRAFYRGVVKWGFFRQDRSTFDVFVGPT
eukprot:3062152-Pyramimonas_sp.AAC.1